MKHPLHIDSSRCPYTSTHQIWWVNHSRCRAAPCVERMKQNKFMSAVWLEDMTSLFQENHTKPVFSHSVQAHSWWLNLASIAGPSTLVTLPKLWFIMACHAKPILIGLLWCVWFIYEWNNIVEQHHIQRKWGHDSSNFSNTTYVFGINNTGRFVTPKHCFHLGGWCWQVIPLM